MSQAFGTKFIVINDVRQVLSSKKYKILGGPWVHLATIRRGFKEYVCFTHQYNHRATYIEELDIHTPGLFKKIEDDQEWADLYRFLHAGGYLKMDGEFKVAKPDGD